MTHLVCYHKVHACDATWRLLNQTLISNGVEVFYQSMLKQMICNGITIDEPFNRLVVEMTSDDVYAPNDFLNKRSSEQLADLMKQAWVANGNGDYGFFLVLKMDIDEEHDTLDKYHFIRDPFISNMNTLELAEGVYFDLIDESDDYGSLRGWVEEQRADRKRKATDNKRLIEVQTMLRVAKRYKKCSDFKKLLEYVEQPNGPMQKIICHGLGCGEKQLASIRSILLPTVLLNAST
jgi:hypothetical protein